MADYEFQITGLRDSPEDLSENVNNLAGKRLAMALCDGFAAAGYECEEVGAEDWGWYFTATRSGARYLVGAMTHQDPEDAATDRPLWGRVFVNHDRGLFDRLRGRNRPDPNDRSAEVLRALLEARPEIGGIEAVE